MIDNRYLRDRPFLVVNFTTSPRDGVNTKIKGWMNNPANIKTYEHVIIVDRINANQNASLIVDIIEGKAIRNITGKEDNDIISHYVGRYSDKIKEALSIWAKGQVSKGMVSPQ